MNPAEYVHIGLTVVLALISAAGLYVMLQIKIGMGEVKLAMMQALGEMREWARETFAEKKFEDRVHALETRAPTVVNVHAQSTAPQTTNNS